MHEAELAILLEPTDNTIQAGCLGNLNARITFHGVSGHSARPWTAENAIEKALDGLRAYAAIEPRPVEIGGLTFTEVATHHADRRRDRDERRPRPRRRERQLPLRPRPLAVERRRVPAQPRARGRDLRARGRLAARPASSPTRRSCTGCASAGDLALEPKQAWTNVADFTSRGIDAVNFGPGATRYAHRRDEQVEIAALERAYESLWRFLTGTRLTVPVSPILERQTTYPFVRLGRGRSARGGARRSR